jgi:hypothetical protein
MDVLTRMYAEAWAQLPVEVVELVVVPAPREQREDDAPA